MPLLRIIVLILTFGIFEPSSVLASEQELEQGYFEYSDKRKYRSDPFEISEFGVRLAYVQVTRKSKKKFLHPISFHHRERERHAFYNESFYEVLGVQKYGPAYVAGVLPGDHFYIPARHFHKRSSQQEYEQHARRFFTDIKDQFTRKKGFSRASQKLDSKRRTYKESIAYFPEKGPFKPLWEALMLNYFEGFEEQPWLLKQSNNKKKRHSKKDQKHIQADLIVKAGQDRPQYPLQGKYQIRDKWEAAQAEQKKATLFAKKEPITKVVNGLPHLARSKAALTELEQGYFEYSDKRKYRSDPFEISEFGLRLAYVQVTRRSKKKILHPPSQNRRERKRHAFYSKGFYEVLGVQKYGPAYVAGVLPGDHFYIPARHFHKRSSQGEYERHARRFFADVKDQLIGKKGLPRAFQKLDSKRRTYKKSVAFFPDNGPFEPVWEALFLNYFKGFEEQPWLVKQSKNKKKRRKKSRRSKKEQKQLQTNLTVTVGQDRPQYPLQGRYQIRDKWEAAQDEKKKAVLFAKEEPIRKAMDDLTNFARSKVSLIKAGACKITDAEMATWPTTYDHFDQIIQKSGKSYSYLMTSSYSFLDYIDEVKREKHKKIWHENFYPLDLLSNIGSYVPNKGILKVKRDNACENERNPLPDFEATVLAYLSRFADPCESTQHGYKVHPEILNRIRDTVGQSMYSQFSYIGNLSRPEDLYGDSNERKRQYGSSIEYEIWGNLKGHERGSGKYYTCFADFISKSILE